MTEPPHQEFPEHVREFLQSLDKEDVVYLGKAMKLVRASETMGKFWKWVFFIMVTVFTGAAAIGQSYDWIVERLTKGGQ